MQGGAVGAVGTQESNSMQFLGGGVGGVGLRVFRGLGECMQHAAYRIANRGGSSSPLMRQQQQPLMRLRALCLHYPHNMAWAKDGNTLTGP